MTEAVITKDNFEEEVLKSNIPVLIDFCASWCGPCKMLAPIIAEIAEEKESTIKVCKVNVDEQPELANDFKVSGISTLVVMEKGTVKNVAVGYRPNKDILALL